MKLTKEQETKLTEMCFAEKSNKEIAAELDIGLTDVHAARSRLGITMPKVKEALAKGVKAGCRSVKEILEEIDKVSKAQFTAEKKVYRCEMRLIELENELNMAKENEGKEV